MIRLKRSAGYAVVLVLLAGVVVAGIVRGEQAAPCTNSEPFCIVPSVTKNIDVLAGATQPAIATPEWLGAQSQPAPARENQSAREVTYSIGTRGNLSASISEFADQVNETLNDARGWPRLGIRFTQVETGGQFTVWLSEASQMTSFSADGCDSYASCRVGSNVVINQDRWQNGADSWNGAGGNLRDYRHMVVNHETGHWLGHSHRFCGGSGQPAPTMQQQTLGMQGCVPNPWPLDIELYSTTLGINV